MKLSKNCDIKFEEIIDDIISFLFAGTETTSNAIAAALFCLKKYPQKAQKLKEELLDNGFSCDTFDPEDYNVDSLHSCDYLNSFLKEVLRMHPPLISSISYRTTDDVKICGVSIPKNTSMRYHSAINHYDPQFWQEPMEFIPERFDPESDYYFTPSGKTRPPLSSLTFGFGYRVCPGQSFALMEIKLIIAYVLTQMDYEVPQATLENEGMGFGLACQTSCPFTVTKI